MSDQTINHDFRFGGIGRLYGPGSMERLQKACVCIIGIGGVGSWTAEALARSGIGKLKLVDLDDVCESNINRQIHALDGSIGQAKVDAMAKRCRLINPNCRVETVSTFFTARTANDILFQDVDFVMDAIDSFRHKTALVVTCREKGIPLIVSGGAGGRIDPTQIRIDDLARSYNDPLLARLRKALRTKHGFPRDTRRKFKIDCVFSPEEAKFPEVCETEEGGSHRLDCSSGYGAATHVTGTFGFFAAARIVEKLISP